MSGHIDNPAFINDDGKSNHSFTPALNSTEDLCQKDGKNYVVEMKDLKKAEEANGEYEPYLHRDVEHPTTNAETLLHLVKGSLGTGILSMPLAFYHSGYIVGIICTIVIGSICTHCMHLIIKAEYELCKRKKFPSLTYPATAEMALLEGPPFLQKLAPYAVHVVNTFLLIYQMGAGCVYTVFIAENIEHVADEYTEHLDVKIWMLIILLPLILINYIRNLKFLAPFSTVANFVTIASFGIILYYLIKADITFEGRNVAGNIADFPLYFGTVLFALEAIGVIMPLENEMKTPKAFKGGCGVLNIGMITIVTLYVGMGLLGFLAYGSDVKDTITINLEQDEILAQVAKIMLAIAIYITHPLQLYVAIDIMWNEYLAAKFETSRYQLFFEYVVRTSIVLITFALAVAIPKLDLFISLFAFPAIIETSTFWYSLTGVRGKIILFKNCCLVIFGALGLVVGTYTSLSKIVEYFNEG
ncbi:proton-coupled amino acid transporter 4 [Asbolus verrucosus]|uniref:Proton-coupled amino acid transporter 4 n=1 Tax=Asbolus verrucosus TaxID=1661398 RepID=A0A482VIH0_ASBVE|nr:proton-coupled amino acid transporter 4 [Asbolus verrucosus]